MEMQEDSVPPDDENKEYLALASFAPAGVHDAYSQKSLRQILMAASQRSLPHLAKVHWELDGERLPNITSILSKEGLKGKIGLVFQQPVMDRVAWEFTTPAAAIAFDPRGAGRIVTFHFDPHSLTPWDLSDPGTVQPGVVRMSVREAYIPRSMKQEQEARRGNPPPPPPFDLFSMEELSLFVRAHGVVPLRLGVLMYTARARYAYDIDVVRGELVQDARSGRFPVTSAVVRSSRLSHGLDRFVARHELSNVMNRVLELVFESNGLSPNEVSMVLQISEDIALSSLETLASRQLVVLDKRTQTYVPLPQAFLTESEAKMELKEEEKRQAEAKKKLLAPPEPPAPKESVRAPTPAAPAAPPADLKDSIEKLLDMVESHPTCPLCGRRMSGQSRDLVCRECLKEMHR
jgi:hypothetical protein